MPTSPESWRTGPGRPLLAVLLTMLVLSAVLAYQAWDAARSHHQVAEAALRDYSGFALWELRRRTESDAGAILNAALISAMTGRLAASGSPPSSNGRLRTEAADDSEVQAFSFPRLEVGVRVLRDDSVDSGFRAFSLGVESAMRMCGCPDAASDFFEIDVESRDLQVARTELGPAFQDWLVSGFLARALTGVNEFRVGMPSQPEPDGRMLVVRMSGADNMLTTPAPVAYGASRSVVFAAVQRGERRHLYGFAIDVAAFANALLTNAVAGPPLLPPSLMGSAGNDQALSVSVWSPAGDTVFRTSGAIPIGTEVLDSLRLATGPLVASVGVRPAMAGNLVIGGLPRSRVPILAGSLGLTATLLVIAFVQLHRQQELFRIRADFVSGVSHELRTPLAQIRLFSELLASDRLDEERRRRSLRILTDETKRLTYLVENILRFSRSDRKSDRVAPTPVEVGSFLREIIEDFNPLAGTHDARIDLTCPDGLHAELDPDAMRQVLLNLLDNAVKYGPRGQTILVNVSGEVDWLRLSVEDEGPGIPISDRERIWEPYRRLSRDVEAATGGSGIGLAVVRRLVELHGGRVFVTEAPGGGSHFVILIPPAAETDGATPERNAT